MNPKLRLESVDYPTLAEVPDLAGTEEWTAVKDFYTRLHGPSFGKVSQAEDLEASPDGNQIAFTASVWISLETGQSKRVAIVNVSDGSDHTAQLITRGPRNAYLPKWSPDGKTLAFLSDQIRSRCYQLYALDSTCLRDTQEPRLLTPHQLDGVVEDFEWSADGNTILIRLAAYGLSYSGNEGSGALPDPHNTSPSWMPSVKSKFPPSRYRTLWGLDVRSHRLYQISRPGENIWRATFAGTEQVVALMSDSPLETAYEESRLVLVNHLDRSGEHVVLREKSHMKVGQFVCSPRGTRLAYAEAVGGDRTKIIGGMRLIDFATKEDVPLPSNNVDIVSLRWNSDDLILAMGLRNVESVAVEINASTRTVRDLWSTSATCAPRLFARATPVPGRGFAVARHAWKMAPEIGIVNDKGKYNLLTSFDHGGARWLRDQYGESKLVTWQAPDGLDIHGFLFLPKAGKAPSKLLVNVHGGPFSAFTDQWLGMGKYVPLLVTHEYAVFNPNPRGSVGRGSAFMAAVHNDPGGKDALDILSGVDHLVSIGLADPSRLGVFGGSYGGYMSAWLTTQTSRFKASIPSCPATDFKLQWLVSDDKDPLSRDATRGRDSLAERRSPLTYADRCETPTLQLVGSKDTCVPPDQAQYFHAALMDQGVRSSIVEYPNEGHGVRTFPALIDASVRTLGWFDTFVV